MTVLLSFSTHKEEIADQHKQAAHYQNHRQKNQQRRDNHRRQILFLKRRFGQCLFKLLGAFLFIDHPVNLFLKQHTLTTTALEIA